MLCNLLRFVVQRRLNSLMSFLTTDTIGVVCSYLFEPDFEMARVVELDRDVFDPVPAVVD